MAKIPGIRVFKSIMKPFRKSSNPVNAHRVVINDTQKQENREDHQRRFNKKSEIDPADIIPHQKEQEEINLEETPAEAIESAVEKRLKSKSIKKGVIPVAVNTSVAGQTRFGFHKKEFTSSRSASISRYKKPATDNSSALEFAGMKRNGSKGKRNKKIALYSGTGILVAVILLLVVLVPGGAAAPASTDTGTDNTNTMQLTEGSSNGVSYVSTSPETSTEVTEALPSGTPITTIKTTVPSPTPIVTTQPEVTPIPFVLDKEIETYRVEASKYYNDMGYSTNTYKYTEQEKYILAQVLYSEARGEGLPGMIAVGNVALNRVLCSGFPQNNLKAVLTGGQFAYNPNTVPNALAKIAASRVLDYEYWVIPQNIYFFKVSSTKDDWNSSRKYYCTIGHHAFYTYPYSGRSKVSSIPPKLFERTYEWPQFGCKPEMRVYKLQYMLNKLGYDVKADKYFGLDTKEALKEFQKKKGLKADGIAGPTTLKKLIEEFGISNYYEKFCEE